jgi:mRNA interferase MazF
MTTIERGMVIDIDLEPVQGSETGKVRPCIVVTNDVYNARVPVIQVVPITAWNEKKGRIKTNVTLETLCAERAGQDVGCRLPANPSDRLSPEAVPWEGKTDARRHVTIDQALKCVFGLIRDRFN